MNAALLDDENVLVANRGRTATTTSAAATENNDGPAGNNGGGDIHARKDTLHRRRHVPKTRERAKTDWRKKETRAGKNE